MTSEELFFFIHLVHFEVASLLLGICVGVSLTLTRRRAIWSVGDLRHTIPSHPRSDDAVREIRPAARTAASGKEERKAA